MNVKEESEKAGLTLNIKKTKSWHSLPTLQANRWGNNRNSDRLFYWAPKSLQMVTAAMKLKDACSLEEKLSHRHILKSRDITLLTKVRLVKAMVFPVVLYGCES